MTPTEDRLRAALTAWADTVEHGPEPWAEHQRRIRRSRRHRMVAAVAAAAAAVTAIAVGLAVARPAGDRTPSITTAPPALMSALAAWAGDGHATSAFVRVGNVGGHTWWLGWWSTRGACLFPWNGGLIGPYGCQRQNFFTTAWTGEPNDEGAFLMVPPWVSSVALRFTDGTMLPARIVDGPRFPSRVAVTLGRDLEHLGDWIVYDRAGDPVVAPGEFDIDPVDASWPANPRCAGHPKPARDIVRLDVDGSTCYALSTSGMQRVFPAAADAVRDPQVNQWLVEVRLRPADARRWAALTTRLAPHHGTVAFVLGNTVVSAPAIQEPITGGMLAIGYPTLGEQGARWIATWLTRRR